MSALTPYNFQLVRNHAEMIAKKTNGTANIVHAELEELQKEGYGDLSKYEDRAIECSLKPKPIMPMIENIRRLKKQGYTVVGATNQDHKQHQAYRKKMKGHGIDMKELFHAILTTRVHHETVIPTDNSFYPLEESDTIYVTRDVEAYKPRVKYFQALKDLVTSINPKVKTIIHTDDKAEYSQGAQQAQVEFVHFQYPTNKETFEDDLPQTIIMWKESLKKYEIIF